MKKICLACLILFISIAAVSASEDIPDIASNSNSEYESISIDDNLQDEMPVDELGEGG